MNELRLAKMLRTTKRGFKIVLRKKAFLTGVDNFMLMDDRVQKQIAQLVCQRGMIIRLKKTEQILI